MAFDPQFDPWNLARDTAVCDGCGRDIVTEGSRPYQFRELAARAGLESFLCGACVAAIPESKALQAALTNLILRCVLRSTQETEK